MSTRLTNIEPVDYTPHPGGKKWTKEEKKTLAEVMVREKVNPKWASQAKFRALKEKGKVSISISIIYIFFIFFSRFLQSFWPESHLVVGHWLGGSKTTRLNWKI